jgi:hypothetical protein
LSSIAVIYSKQGNYLESERMFEKLFNLIDTSLIVGDEFYIRNLLSLGLIAVTYFALTKYVSPDTHLICFMLYVIGVFSNEEKE